MTERKATPKKAAKKQPSKGSPRTAKKADSEKVSEIKPVEESAAPSMKGPGYDVGYLGHRHDLTPDEDYSIAGQVKRLAEQ